MNRHLGMRATALLTGVLAALTVTPTAAPAAPPAAPPPAAVEVPAEALSHRVTVRGRVVNGAEAGCLILVTQRSRQYLLLGGDPAVVRAGARLRVTGLLRSDIVTSCQQGRPLEVKSARRIPTAPGLI